MNDKINKLFDDFHLGKINIHWLQKEILSLMGENETGVSDSPTTHGDLPLVRKSECEAIESDKLTGESVESALENRIDSESLCVECGERPSVVIAWCRECMIEYNRKKAKEKES